MLKNVCSTLNGKQKTEEYGPSPLFTASFQRDALMGPEAHPIVLSLPSLYPLSLSSDKSSDAIDTNKETEKTA